MSFIKRAVIAASFVVVATGAQAQAPSHSGGAVAIGSDSASGAPVARPRAAAPVRDNAVRNYGAVAIGADSASGQPVARPRATSVQPYKGATEGARAIGSDR
jgi:hypothetical protein